MRILHPKSFTLIELLVVVAIIAVLVALLLPALSKARSTAQATVCASNCKQMGNLFHYYLNDYNEHYPYSGWGGQGTWWWNALAAYYNSKLSGLDVPEFFFCPSETWAGLGYSYNTWLDASNSWPTDAQIAQKWYSTVKHDAITYPGETPLVSEGHQRSISSWSISNDFYYRMRNRHNGGNNWLFADLHVNWFIDFVEYTYCNPRYIRSFRYGGKF